MPADPSANRNDAGSRAVARNDAVVNLSKRRGFVFPSSEIYGGSRSAWDYGPLGVELKKNIKDVWWHDMVRNPPPGPDGREIQMVGVDCAMRLIGLMDIVSSFTAPYAAAETAGRSRAALSALAHQTS